MKHLKPDRIICLLLMAVLMPVQAFCQTLAGRVVAIADGDTFTLLTGDNEQIKVRLAEIDTPEKAQPYGQKAKQQLSELIFSKEVRVEQTDIDRYGRIVAQVYVGEIYVNAAMVRSGAAWVYRKYSSDAMLLQLEEQARKEGRGLWSLPEAERQPPWEWRSNERTDHAAADQEPSASFECGSKRYCKEMTSCEEAKYYLEHCGLTRLDADQDGIPCESICR